MPVYLREHPFLYPRKLEILRPRNIGELYFNDRLASNRAVAHRIFWGAVRMLAKDDGLRARATPEFTDLLSVPLQVVVVLTVRVVSAIWIGAD